MKKQILASQIALKRSANNERQLQQALSQLFRKLSDEVLGNLEEYWSEYQLLQGQITLMVKPIEEAQEEYYQILEKYIRREYKLGNKEAQRLVDLAMTKQAHKSIFDKLRKAVNIKATRYNLFGTLEESEARLNELIRVDPLCYKFYKSTKGLMDNCTHFDDRTYVRFKVE